MLGMLPRVIDSIIFPDKMHDAECSKFVTLFILVRSFAESHINVLQRTINIHPVYSV